MREVLTDAVQVLNRTLQSRAGRTLRVVERENYDGTKSLYDHLHIIDAGHLKPWQHQYDRVEVSWADPATGQSGTEAYGTAGWQRRVLKIDNPLVQSRSLAAVMAQQYHAFFAQSRSVIELETIPQLELEELDRVQVQMTAKNTDVARATWWLLTKIGVGCGCAESEAGGSELMPESFSGNVVGGVRAPRFLLVGPELSPNVSFEDDLTGVGGSAGASTRVQDSSTHWGDYVLRVEDDDAGSHEYAEITIDAGETVELKKFIVSFYARNDDDDAGDWTAHGFFQHGGTIVKRNYQVDRRWRQFIHEQVIPAGVAGNSLAFRLYPISSGQPEDAVGVVRVDNLRVRRVLDEISLPLPDKNRARDGWREDVQSRYMLADGREKTYLRGYRYFYSAGYDWLSAAQELARRKLMTGAQEILFFPHRDAPVHFFCRWDDDFENQWAFGIAAGHAGNVALVGTELMPYLWDEIVDQLSEYEPPEDEFVGEGAVGFF